MFWFIKPTIAQKKCKTVPYQSKFDLIDSFPIVPNSVELKEVGAMGTPLPFRLENQKILMEIDQVKVVPTEISICYQTLPFAFQKPYSNRKIEWVDSLYIYTDPQKKWAKGPRIETKEELFETQGLQKTGSISRGIGLGNTQDVTVNSALNLQLEGKLSQDLKIRAAISDQNIPIQPDGNTALIQDFDRVYVELEHGLGKVSAGDLQLKNKNESYFLKYFKNVQGGTVDATYKTVQDYKGNTYAGVAISKGKFASIQLAQSEGVLGPYRLNGPNGERFIIVLANTEKVFLDGKQLKRGFNYDYVVDYNQATITFTSNVLITKFSRIRVDFEYNERNYNRTTFAAGHVQELPFGKFFFNYYTERDDPNSVNVNVNNLTENDKQLLNRIGDTLQRANIESATLTSFNANQVLYEKIDTLVDLSQYIGIYRVSTRAEASLFQVSFSDVGQGNGDYVLVTGASNGRLYRWVAPLGNQKQGRYAPVKLLITPKRKDMLSLGTEILLSSKEKITTEVAMSQNDVNLFSDKDKQNDRGFALKTSLLSSGRPIAQSGYIFQSKADYEFTNTYFSAIDRFRTVEFDRDWNNANNQQITNNLNSLQNSPNDHIVHFQLGAQKDPFRFASYQLHHRNRLSEVNGFQHKAELSQMVGRLQLKGDFFYMNNQLQKTAAQWFRYQLETKYQGKIWQPFYQFSADQNTIRSSGKDSIVGSAMFFDQHKIGIRTADTGRNSLQFDYAIRNDHLPFKGDIPIASRSNTANALLSKQLYAQQEIRFNATYRELINTRDTVGNRVEQTIMGRVDHLADLFKKHVRSELTYTNGTGREFKRQYLFIRVAPGQGDYVWNDDNRDGVQQLNEFYTKLLSGNTEEFIKTFIPTDQFIRAYTSGLNYRLNLLSPRSWREASGIKKVFGKLSNTSSWNTEKKTTIDRAENRFIPFIVLGNDSLSSLSNLRSHFFFNRSSPLYGLDWVYVQNNQRQFLTNGFERKNNDEWTINARVSFQNKFNARLSFSRLRRGSGSDYLNNRNYWIENHLIKPEISFQPNQTYRITLAYLLGAKNNLTPNQSNAEGSRNQELSLEGRINQVSNRSVTGTLKYIHIRTIALENFNNPIGYELLEALRPGSNITWSLLWQQKLANGLQISLNYEGRKSENNPVVHVGRVQVSALF